MSTPGFQKRLTPSSITAMKGTAPIVCLTAYTTPVARLLDEHCDLLLVGDSLGMVLYGMESTIGVTLDMMIAHGKAVMRGVSRACVVVDMPFGTYQESKEVAFRNAVRILQETGCDAVKLEGGEEMVATIGFLTARGIPVLGHIGLMPQLVHTAGGYRSVGHSEHEAAKIRRDSHAIGGSGAFAFVIEGTVESLAREVTAATPVPTIGIGASSACDGQILVSDDILGLFNDFTPRFVKRYDELGKRVSAAAADYAADVRARRFPAAEHTFKRRS
ncbi:3-methyl-2-oxobutanoate hydroxymethyltransferase [Rhizobium sp. BK529]|uniref:3-methyl-2-oxobutanoate hydroxymethyltransferase n=1 Tax=unclassified Rhizobium TaxID=2613769 RepID=UPI001049D9D9|nr:MULTISPECIES: 3-methyl-2-oxobutanoate hydroxymethyltransferase [unclassified Rhizobium]MBB3593986.1 3-methyl-2-oxobutanoate hydroxymethyltransferase [Rhizobium sp. BK529]TCS01442.1 ketopantoate hydroxymethyltransferase [Rhizobium sp. BK418]